jgi:HEAT repeat protein
VKQFPDAIEVADACSRDPNPTVRKWCSQSLGRIGAPALPKILELLESGNKSLKDAGQNALAHFGDPTAKDELQQIMQDNTGWMANNKKLQIARAVGIALLKIDNEQKMVSAETTGTSNQ